MLRCLMDPTIPEDSRCSKCCIHCEDKDSCNCCCCGVNEWKTEEEIDICIKGDNIKINDLVRSTISLSWSTSMGIICLHSHLKLLIITKEVNYYGWLFCVVLIPYLG